MEHLVLGLVLLAQTLAASSPLRQRDLGHIKEVVLDMAPTAFDDQYRGCSHIMEEELEELNRTEFANNRVYAQVWNLSAALWRSRGGHIPQLPALRWEHAVAIMAYTLEMPSHNPMYEVFNAAVREAGRSREEYLNNFHFKVLHFLLTEARHALWDAQTRECHCVYRGIKGIRFIAQRHQSVRFGHFTSTSFCDKAAQEFGIDTTFRVQTCYGVPIRDFSDKPEEEEVLIPPFEVFKVTNVTHKGNRPIIHLRSQNVKSTYNCELAKEKRCKSRPCTFSAGRSIAGDHPHLWGLLLAATALAAAGGP